MSRRKLLVLDVNGLLVDTYFHKEPLPKESPDARVGNFFVYKRPFCGEFLQFCLENFVVGIWSSAREYNVNNLVNYVFGDTKEKLAFSWHQSDCTDVGLKAPDNQFKPLFLKELSKLWGKVKGDLPWSIGDYGPFNTLLVDDTPYKAILNPPNTGIFPRSYTAQDYGDDFLGGALRNYLEGIRDAASVQVYVESNPFGEPSITSASPLWSYVSKVVLKVNSAVSEVGDGIAQAMQVVTAGEEADMKQKHRKSKHKKQNHHLDPLQLGTQSSDFHFASEAVELQSSENILQPITSGTQSSDSITVSRSFEEAPKVGSQEEVNFSVDNGNSLHIDSNQSGNYSQLCEETHNYVGSLSSKRRRVLSEQYQGPDSVKQKRPHNRGDSSFPFEPKKADKEFFKKEEPQSKENSSSPAEFGNHERANGKQFQGTDVAHKGERNGLLLEQVNQRVDEKSMSNREQGDQKGADKELHKDEQPDSYEQGNHKRVDEELYRKELPDNLEAGVNVRLDKIHKEHCDDADGHGVGSFREVNENSMTFGGLDSLRAGRIQKGHSNDDEVFHRKSIGKKVSQKSRFLWTSDKSIVLKRYSECSDGSRDEYRRHQNQHTFTMHNEGDYHNRGSIGHSQDWERKRRYYQSTGNKMPQFQGREQRGYYQSRGNEMPHLQGREQRGFFSDYKQHTRHGDRHELDKRYLNKTKPYSQDARQSQHRWSDRSMDASRADLRWGPSTAGSRSWGESNQGGRSLKFEGLTDASLTVSSSNLVTQPQNRWNNQKGISVERRLKHDEFGSDQGWGASRHTWQEVDRGFEQRGFNGALSSQSERMQKLDAYIPDSHLATLPEARWDDSRGFLSGKKRSLEIEDKNVGNSSRSSRSRWDEHRQGWASKGSSRNWRDQNCRNW